MKAIQFNSIIKDLEKGFNITQICKRNSTTRSQLYKEMTPKQRTLFDATKAIVRNQFRNQEINYIIK